MRKRKNWKLTNLALRKKKASEKTLGKAKNKAQELRTMYCPVW